MKFTHNLRIWSSPATLRQGLLLNLWLITSGRQACQEAPPTLPRSVSLFSVPRSGVIGMGCHVWHLHENWGSKRSSYACMPSSPKSISTFKRTHSLTLTPHFMHRCIILFLLSHATCFPKASCQHSFNFVSHSHMHVSSMLNEQTSPSHAQMAALYQSHGLFPLF